MNPEEDDTGSLDEYPNPGLIAAAASSEPRVVELFQSLKEVSGGAVEPQPDLQRALSGAIADLDRKVQHELEPRDPVRRLLRVDTMLKWTSLGVILLTVAVVTLWLWRTGNPMGAANGPPPEGWPADEPEVWWPVKNAQVARVACSHFHSADGPDLVFDGIISYDGNDPRNRWACWGSNRSQDWIGWVFSESVDLVEVVVHFFDDGGGTLVPVSYHLETFDNGGWQRVPDHNRTPGDPTAGVANRLQLYRTRGSVFRLVVVHQQDHSSGITEIELTARENR
jgi:hypothetical protein